MKVYVSREKQFFVLWRQLSRIVSMMAQNVEHSRRFAVNISRPVRSARFHLPRHDFPSKGEPEHGKIGKIADGKSGKDKIEKNGIVRQE